VAHAGVNLLRGWRDERGVGGEEQRGGEEPARRHRCARAEILSSLTLA
jgi:hypothetical protein